jgi:hypothetical protein
MTNKQLLNTFLSQETLRNNNSTKSLSFFGRTLYSYNTLIASIDPEVKQIKVNTEKYSPTTSKQVNLLMRLAREHGYTIFQ